MRLLMVAPGPPSPSGKGYQVRLHQQIIGLAARHSVTLLTFAGTDGLDPQLSAACHHIVVVPWSLRAAAPMAVLRAGRLPLSVALYRSREMWEAIASEVEGGRHDLVQLQLVRMAPYLPLTAGLPTVLDLLDAAELNMHERARASAPPIRQFLHAEADRLGAYERRAIAMADLSLLISRRDLAYLGDLARARVLPNGIDPPDPQLVAPEREARTLVFSGRMSYFPNSDAATWFANEVFPLIRAVEPSCAFRIVGREPTAAVKRLGSRPGITVAGPVQLMEAELLRASISVCPMRFGSGMQTKILEAMATGTPVIGTTKALEGIPDDLSQFLPLADSPTDFASEVVRILRDPAPAMKRASEGLAAIRSAHLWGHSVAELERLHEETIAGFRSSSRRRREMRSA